MGCRTIWSGRSRHLSNQQRRCLRLRRRRGRRQPVNVDPPRTAGSGGDHSGQLTSARHISPIFGRRQNSERVIDLHVPLSARCKFGLFLKQTYSPYTFASAGFQATEAEATGQWHHYAGGTQGWAKRLGATLANTESRRFIQTFALSTILHQEPRYFPSRKRNFGARVWYSTTRVVITKNDNGDNTFNTSELLALCSPVRYKMPTTQDMTGLSGIP